ncbi:hypothetical protein KUTeg_017703 [Tegillarca granosa]|uniref:DNA mitochondrial polymerase exonuclease domain-containing protein n=1 Tax=Tegillarca granosa TaxID=220873 RepID=A0ABQ9EKQ0_TEGGR|nr:hypothetical protein KUTeg_017703 [Tegillarca granosa]
MYYMSRKCGIIARRSKFIKHHVTWCQKRWFHKTILRFNDPIRRNEINIQMLSENIHRKIFKNLDNVNKLSTNDFIKAKTDKKAEQIEEIQKHLEKHGLWNRDIPFIKNVDFNLPELIGDNIDEHFRKLATDQVSDYIKIADDLVSCSVPERPNSWVFEAGWTKYDEEGNTTKVAFPEENAIVFDIEVLVPEGPYPTMATAVSPKYWYSWCGEQLIKDKFKWTSNPHLADLIPLETCKNTNTPPDGDWKKRLVIGHNVGFDRSFVKEQYYIQKSLLRFMDTMSLHIAVCGLTNFQRILYQSTVKKESNRKEVREYLDKHKDNVIIEHK